MMKHHGLSRDDVTFPTSGNSTNRITALSTGAVQAIAVSDSTRAAPEKIGTLLLKSGDSPVSVPGSMLFASLALLSQRRDALQEFMRALSAATQWVRAHPRQAAHYCADGSGASRLPSPDSTLFHQNASLSDARRS